MRGLVSPEMELGLGLGVNKGSVMESDLKPRIGDSMVDVLGLSAPLVHELYTSVGGVSTPPFSREYSHLTALPGGRGDSGRGGHLRVLRGLWGGGEGRSGLEKSGDPGRRRELQFSTARLPPSPRSRPLLPKKPIPEWMLHLSTGYLGWRGKD